MMRIVRGVFWWTITIITLFVLDDMVFGPGFWILALIDPVVSTAMAFGASAVVTVWLVRAGIKPEPGRLASFMLRHLMLERKNTEIAQREASVKRTATSIVGAILVTPLIGGVIPSLLLHKHAVVDDAKIKQLSLLLAVIYSTEFALIHGGYGFGAVLRSIV